MTAEWQQDGHNVMKSGVWYWNRCVLCEEGTSRIMSMHQHGVWSSTGWRGGLPVLDLGGFWHSARHNKSLWQRWHYTMPSATERYISKKMIKNCPSTGHTQTMNCSGYWGLANASAATQPKQRDWKEVSTLRPSGLSIHMPRCLIMPDYISLFYYNNKTI